MIRVSDLVALQDVDHALDSKRQILEDVRQQMGEDGGVPEAREAVTAQEQAIAGILRRQRDLEAQAEDVQAHLQPLERKLYDGSVRNPKELQGLQQDVEALKRRQRDLEDRALTVMAEAEQAGETLDAERRRAANVEAAWRQTLEVLGRQEAALRAEVQTLEEQRARIAGAVDPQVLRLYERLRAGKQGRAVVRLERGICQGCRIDVPSTVATRARSGLHIVQCPSCERILYPG